MQRGTCLHASVAGCISCALVNRSIEIIESLRMKNYENENEDNDLEAEVHEATGAGPGTSPRLNPVGRLLRLPEVLKIIPVSRSTWYEGVRRGHYPKPVRLSVRTSAWPEASIHRLANKLAHGY
jgi:prophage regulatory protein